MPRRSFIYMCILTPRVDRIFMFRIKFTMAAKLCESSWTFVVLCCLSYSTLLTAERTKWCANESCLEPLFESTVSRHFSHSDAQLLYLVEGMNLKITSFMYSDRVDFMGAIAPDGRAGKIYKNFIDHGPFVEFLKSAIESNRIFYVVDDVDGPIKKAVKVENYTPLIKMYENKLEEMKKERKTSAAYSVENASAEQMKNDSAVITPSPQIIAQSKVHESAPKPIAEATTTTTASSVKSSNIVFAPPTNTNENAILAQLTDTNENINLSENQKNEKIQTVTPVPIETITPESFSEATTPESVVSASPKNSIIDEKDQTTTEPPSSKNQQVAQEITSSHYDNKPKIDPVIVRRSVKSAIASSGVVSSQPPVTAPESPTNEPLKQGDRSHIKAEELPPIQAVKDEMNDKIKLAILESKVVEPQQEQQPIGGINAAPSTTISPQINTATVSPINNSEHQKAEKVVESTTATTLILENIPSTVAPAQEVIPEDPSPVSNVPVHSSTIETKNDENKTNIDADAFAGDLAENLVNAINNINEPSEKSREEIKNIADIVNTESLRIERLPDDDIKSIDDSSKYCHKETCNSISEAMLADSLKSLDALHNCTVPFLNAYIDELRVFLPYPFSTFDTTGIIVFGFLIVVFTIRLISVALSSSGPQQDVVEKRLLHDCMTSLKEKEVELTKLRVQATNGQHLAEMKVAAQKLHAANVELNARNVNLDNKVQKQADLIAEYDDKIKQNARHVQDLDNALRAKEREIENMKENISGLSTRNDALSGDLSTALGQVKNLQNEKESLEFEFKMTREKLDDATKKLYFTERELAVWKESNSDLQKQVDQCMIVIDELQQKMTITASPSKKVKRGANADIKSADSSDSSGNVIVKKASNVLVATENDRDTVNEQDENGAGSGGSAAWSDFSEMDEPNSANKGVEDRQPRKMSTESMTRRPKSSARAELFEIAELKSHIRVLESERDSLRTTIAVEQKEKDGLSERLEQLKSDLADKRREAEQREVERFALQSQCQKLLHMVEERDNKTHEKEEQLKQLHERISQSERELRKVEDEKREVASRVRELENSLRKSDDTNAKLENKLYHEERRLTGKIHQLQMQLDKLHSLSPNASGLSDLNLSGNLSDRDFEQRMQSMPVGDLWSGINSDGHDDSLNELDRYRSNVSHVSSNVGLSRHRSSRKSLQKVPPSNNADISGGEMSSRASPFELEQIWLNRNNSVKEKRNSGTYRTRSRSTGRQSVSSGRQSARLVGLVPSPSSNMNLLR